MIGFCYRNLIRPLLFCFEPELVHETFLNLGEFLGRLSFLRPLLKKTFVLETKVLEQSLWGINFKTPIGLAAGFDYQAKLTQLLPYLGFGFETVGTITNQSCPGNPKPRLGRLPRSRSLMVNKGFKNPGAAKIIEKLERLEFDFPLGISLGVTNTEAIKDLTQGIQEIVAGFEKFLNSGVKNSYYELNISCPNLKTKLEFYSPANLRALLEALAKLPLEKPLWVKMPISQPDEEVLKMLEVLNDFSFVKGVVFGNLQKDRENPYLDRVELKKFPVGNFSGRPTEARANQLITLAYQNYSSRFVIIGCGGVFSAEQAYEKIKRGASLVQLITGLVFEGPQLVAEINRGLVKLLQQDGYHHLAEAVGSGVK